MIRQPEIWITGVGAITPLGHSANTTFEALIQGKTAVTNLGETDAFRCIQPGYAAVVQDFALASFVEEAAVSALKHHDPSLHYAAAAMQEALAQAGAAVEPEHTALVVASGMGGVELHQNHQDAFRSKLTAWRGANQEKPARSRDIASVRTIVGIIPNAAAGMLANLFGIRGESIAISTACASGASAHGVAVRMLLSGEYRRVVVVTTDQAVTPHGMAAFDVLSALASPGEDPQRMSRPYDVSRNGFLMANGACAYVLELAHGAHQGTPIAMHAGYAARSDGDRAEGMTKPSEDGSAVCEAILGCRDFMGFDSGRRCLWVSAHGTSTPIGDVAEARGITRAFAEHPQHNWCVSSIKGSLGHMIGAAPGAAIVFGALALNHSLSAIPATTNLRDVDPSLPSEFVKRLLKEPKKMQPYGVLVLASGFGGHHAAVALTRPR